MTRTSATERPRRSRRRPRPDRLPVWLMSLTCGLVGILCCVGPTVLALLGIVSAGTAFAWATNLYGNYAWWFRLGGLAALAGLVWWSIRRRNNAVSRGCDAGGGGCSACSPSPSAPT
jgi:membrane associated rhomboid family serine protease